MRARRSCATRKPSCCSRTSSRPLIIAARARPQQRQGRPAQRSRDQRLRRDRPDRLYPVGPARGGGQRQPASGRHRARARPRRRRPLDPHAGGRQGSYRHHASRLWCSARWRSPPAPAMPAWASWRPGQQAALGNFLAFTRTQEATADAAGASISLQGAGSAARACSTSSASCRTRNIGSRSTPRTATTAPTRFRRERIQALEQMLQERSGLGQADRPGARSAVPAGQGQALSASSIPSRR